MQDQYTHTHTHKDIHIHIGRAYKEGKKHGSITGRNCDKRR